MPKTINRPSEEEIPCTGLLDLGDFAYAGYRVRLHAKDNEREFYVLIGSGQSMETRTFSDLGSARDEFECEANAILGRMSRSAVSLYCQQKAHYVNGSKAKFAKKDKSCSKKTK